MEQLEKKLKSLLSGEYSSLSLNFNDDHSCNYMTAQEWHDEYGEYGGFADQQRIDWVSEEERLKAIAENSVWTLQWYPNTPVGFNCIGASSLSALIGGLDDDEL